MKRCYIFFLTSFAFIFGEVYETNTINTMKNHIGSDVLFLYDLDNTIIRPIQQLGTDEWFYSRYKGLLNAKLEAVGKDTSDNKNSYIELKKQALEEVLIEWVGIQALSKIEPIEEGVDGMIQSLQEKKIPMMGFTTRGLSMVRCSHNQLKKLNIDFKKTAPMSRSIYFENSGVFYDKGILFTTGTHKGDALVAFVDMLKTKPKKVVFINDKLSNLKELELGCIKLGIKFMGLRYNALDKRVKALNEKEANQLISNIHKMLDESM